MIVGFLMLGMCVAKATHHHRCPVDTIDYWFVAIGDSLIFNSNRVKSHIEFLYLAKWKKKSTSEALAIYWGGCTPNRIHEVDIIDAKGKKKLTFESNAKLAISPLALNKLKKGYYTLIWNRNTHPIILGKLQIE